MTNRLLSKSKYLAGMQCLKYLWFLYNDPSKVPEADGRTKFLFDQGHQVGELAKKLFPEGISIPADDFMLNLGRTKELLGEKRTLFEAGFMTAGLFSRIDILNPAGSGTWDIIEVKSSTAVKDENLHDVSFQKYCVEKAGLEINKCFLAYVNNRYIKDGDIDPSGLFKIQDITEDVASAGRGLDDRIQAMRETISVKECPEMPVGSFCKSPYECPVTACWEELPENNIFSLYRGGKKCFDLFNAGIFYLREIPDSFKLNVSQQIQKSCDLSGEPYLNKKAVTDFLAAIKSPVYYIDFETFAPAIPLFDGTRPYQKIPFQFSLHVVDDGGETEHYGYLAEGTGDPRPRFLVELKSKIETAGSIVTYNQNFEAGVLRDLAAAFPEYAGWVDEVCGRMVDLQEPFRSFSYYHPDQNGSNSIKSVLPALTGKGYKGMTIADGEAASRAFLNVTYSDVSEEERNQIRADLEKYCGLDTGGMIWIVEKLKSLLQTDL